MECASCQGPTIKWGKDRNGHQRHRCKSCGVTITDTPPNPIAPLRLGMDRATLVLQLLVEGMSIRSTERVTGHHRDTITRLLVLAGDKCERCSTGCWSASRSKTCKPMRFGAHRDEGADEERAGDRRSALGDSWCFVGIERTSKLVLAHHLGRRTFNDTDLFVSKLAGHLGHLPAHDRRYRAATRTPSASISGPARLRQLIKQYGRDAAMPRRYTPADDNRRPRSPT